MGLTNVAGVFSRYFIVGFFLPCFFGLVILAQLVDSAFLPAVYREASASGQAVIVGGAALLAGLLLLGLHYPILRLFEGYPLAWYGRRGPVRPVYAGLMRRQRQRLEKATKATESGSDAERFDACWRRDLMFPGHHLLLPTSFGNALRAFERHSMTRWHLNGIGVWPHVEMLLTAQEAQVHADAKGDVAFFVNGSLVALAGGSVLIANAAWHGNGTAPIADVLICAAAFVVGALLYLASVQAVVRWGSAVRASIDLHRREVYEKLGLRAPAGFSDERRIAYLLNALLLVGDRIDDEYAAAPAPVPEPTPTAGPATPAQPDNAPSACKAAADKTPAVKGAATT